MKIRSPSHLNAKPTHLPAPGAGGRRTGLDRPGDSLFPLPWRPLSRRADASERRGLTRQRAGKGEESMGVSDSG